MRGYSDINRATSSCVHFIENEEIKEDEIDCILEDLSKKNIKIAYVDCQKIIENADSFCDAVAIAINAENSPYGEEHWIRLLDDMISLSKKNAGLVLVIDNANLLFKSERKKTFDLIEAFLIQFHHWLDKNKPCHLCFQMEFNRSVSGKFLKKSCK